MNLGQIEHLKLIEGVINRLASNSFAYKAWAITIASGEFALYFTTSNRAIAFVGIGSTIMFWMLDGYYLSQERMFRKIYEENANMCEAEWTVKPFVMKSPMDPKKGKCSRFSTELMEWLKALKSKTVIILYFPLLLIFILIGIRVVS